MSDRVFTRIFRTTRPPAPFRSREPYPGILAQRIGAATVTPNRSADHARIDGTAKQCLSGTCESTPEFVRAPKEWFFSPSSRTKAQEKGLFLPLPVGEGRGEGSFSVRRVLPGD